MGDHRLAGRFVPGPVDRQTGVSLLGADGDVRGNVVGPAAVFGLVLVAIAVARGLRDVVGIGEAQLLEVVLQRSDRLLGLEAVLPDARHFIDRLQRLQRTLRMAEGRVFGRTERALQERQVVVFFRGAADRGCDCDDRLALFNCFWPWSRLIHRRRCIPHARRRECRDVLLVPLHLLAQRVVVRLRCLEPLLHVIEVVKQLVDVGRIGGGLTRRLAFFAVSEAPEIRDFLRF
mmetsp:Transcript_53276/g.124913  ORF Transcript_53276/g.124913 Transcript_53276/m.124913 type:complete len:232 (+) Transcript_53276:162-857(+)